MQDWIWIAPAGVLALVALGLAFALVRTRSETRADLAAARSETAQLREELTALASRMEQPEAGTAASGPGRAPDASYVITDLGRDHDPDAGQQAAPKIEPALFVDLVLRETVVKAASFAHGVRRALAPESRNRIRFEMRREVKRARKQRRVDTRQARRQWEARQRAEVNDEDSAA